MPSIPKLKVAGLYTNGNQHEVPEGALAQATNCVVRASGQLEPRRGLPTMHETTIPDPFGVQNAVAFYNSGRVLQYTENGGTNKLAYSASSPTPGAWTAHSGSYTPPDPALLRMKFAEARQNLYFTTSAGIYGKTSLSGTPSSSGVSRPVEDSPNCVIKDENPNTTGAWLEADSAVAYRVVIGILDANNNLKLSAPSGRIVVVNEADVTATLQRTSNVVTATTTTAHNLPAGRELLLTNPSGTFGAGPWTITPGSSTTFDYSEMDSDAGPTAGFVFTNGTRRVSLAFFFDTDVTTSHFFRIYRSTSSDSAATDPGDELFQIYERRFTSTDITNRFVLFTDSTPETALYSNPLYTNPRTGDGILAANELPPAAKDIAYWQDRMWFANTTDRHRLSLQLIGTGAPDGVQHEDLLTIGDQTYRFSTSASSSPYTHVAIDADPSPSEAIRKTANNLVQAINTRWYEGDSTIRAYYTSSQGDPPGKIVLEGALGGSTFYVAATRPASFNPVPATLIEITEGSSSRTGSTVTITTGSSHGFAVAQQVYLASNQNGGATPGSANFANGVKTVATTPTGTTFTYTESGSAVTMTGTYQVFATTTASKNDRRTNGVSYSHLLQPEAVPTTNYFEVGARNQEILRIVPLRDRLFVFKADGIFTVAGSGSSFAVDLLDTSAVLKAPDTAVVLGGLIYCLTNQGVVTVSESGVNVVSYPIERSLVVALANSQVSKSFAVAHETDRLYILALYSAVLSADTQFVYNYVAKAWTDWDVLGLTHGGTDPAVDLLSFCLASSKMRRESRTLSTSTPNDDYADDRLSVTVSAVDTAAGTMTTDFSGLDPGYVIEDSAGNRWVVLSSNQSTVYYSPSSTVAAPATGAGFLWGRYPVTVKFARESAGAPGLTKHFGESQLHFDARSFAYLTLTFSNEYTSASSTYYSPANEYSALSATQPTMKNLRSLVPLELQRSTQLQIGFVMLQAFGFFRLDGYTLEVNPGSPRVHR